MGTESIATHRFNNVRRWFIIIAAAFAVLATVSPAVIFANDWQVLFSDDFETGGGAWELDPGWSIVDQGGNNVLEGRGHSWPAFQTASRGQTIGSSRG